MIVPKLRSFCPFVLFLIFITTARATVWTTPCAAQSAASPVAANARVEHVSQLVAEGLAELEKNNLTTARGFFQKAVEENPKDVAALTYLGIIADRAADLTEAEHQFAAAIQADPLSPFARNNYGAVLLKLGRTKEAAAEFEASLRLDPQQASASVNLAQIRSATKAPADLRQARELFERAYAIAPDVEIARALTIIALQLKDREAAANYFREYSARLGGSSSQTSNAAARAELGSALLEAELPKQAAVELEAAVIANPAEAEAIVRLAKAYIALNDLPAAGRTLEAALARGLDAAPIYALLASVYEKSGHIENAIRAMQLAIQRDPQSENYRFLYGMLLTSMLAPEAAVIRLKEALELFPRSARLWLALGIARFKSGKSNDEALKALTRAIELDPKVATAYAYLGMTYADMGEYEEAIKAYTQALVVNQKLGVVDFLIADAVQKHATADTARIEVHLVRAVKLEPSFAPAGLALGKLYLRTNRLPEAAGELERAIKVDPSLAEAYYQLSRVYTRLKRTAEAKTILAAFQRLDTSQKTQEQNERKDIARRLAHVMF